MYTNEKKVLSVMTYFTLIAFMVTFVVFSYILLTNIALPLWAKVAYYVIISALVLNILFDIACTFSGNGKFASGFILYILSFALVVIGIVLGSTVAVGGAIPTEMLGVYGGIMGVALVIDILAIIIYGLGEKIVVYDESILKKRK